MKIHITGFELELRMMIELGATHIQFANELYTLVVPCEILRLHITHVEIFLFFFLVVMLMLVSDLNMQSTMEQALAQLVYVFTLYTGLTHTRTNCMELAHSILRFYRIFYYKYLRCYTSYDQPTNIFYIYSPWIYLHMKLKFLFICHINKYLYTPILCMKHWRI